MDQAKKNWRAASVRLKLSLTRLIPHSSNLDSLIFHIGCLPRILHRQIVLLDLTPCLSISDNALRGTSCRPREVRRRLWQDTIITIRLGLSSQALSPFLAFHRHKGQGPGLPPL